MYAATCSYASGQNPPKHGVLSMCQHKCRCSHMLNSRAGHSKRTAGLPSFETTVCHTCSTRMLGTCIVSVALQVSTVQYGDFSIMLKEGALGDGLGARVWAVAHTLCRYRMRWHLAVNVPSDVVDIDTVSIRQPQTCECIHSRCSL